MELTVKCKKGFENWIIDSKKGKYVLGVFSYTLGSYLIPFNKLPDSMKFGVYQDYFDTVGIQIDINFGRDIIDKTDYWNYYFDEAEELIQYKSRPEARTEAIKKANEIRNNQLKTINT